MKRWHKRKTTWATLAAACAALAPVLLPVSPLAAAVCKAAAILFGSLAALSMRQAQEDVKEAVEKGGAK